MVGLKQLFVRSKSAIQSAIIPGNDNVKKIAKQLQQKGFDVKAILSPTVPEGQERLRFCIHSYNSKEEISEVLRLLSTFVFE
jgi:8-amino-7-oxononanoate synthase